MKKSTSLPSLLQSCYRRSIISPRKQLGTFTTVLSQSPLASPTSSSSSIRSFSNLSPQSINPRVLEAQYAVRGELVQRADHIAQILSNPQSSSSSPPYPFTQIVHCNIGNPQSLSQPPLTFPRQVLSLCQYPDLLKSPKVGELFPSDAISRAKKYINDLPGGSMGSYTASAGLKTVRDEIAKFISSRDGYPASGDEIFLTGGASVAVNYVLNLLISSPNDAILTPIPQYPLYSATLALFGAHVSGYYLDESKGWSLSEKELEQALSEGIKKGHKTRALVVINPGNPTGQCLPYNVMQQVVKFCEKHKLVLLADEVYQANVYSSTPFTSFKKVVRDLKSSIDLFSFHSTSKGFYGECGQRGGYVEVTNVNSAVHAQLLKLASIGLCSNTSGQIMMGLMVNPPSKGEESYNLYEEEKISILESLKRRAIKVAAVLNECEGISCQLVEGAMYAFPKIELPPGAVKAATSAGKVADTFYCLSLLESTGLVVVPGSGFGQRDGEWHFRMTILPAEKDLDRVLGEFKSFHSSFMKKYKSE